MTVSVVLAVLFAGFGSLTATDSPTTTVFVIAVPEDAFTIAAI